MKIGIVILNWQQPQITLAAVNSLLKINSSHFSYHLFLVDNHSADNSLSLFQKKFAHHQFITLLSTGSNLGYVGGNNYGLQCALKKDFDYLLVANNDLIFDVDFLGHLTTFAKNHPQAGIIGPKIYFAPGFEYHHQQYSHNQIGKVIWSVGGHLDWNNVLGSNLGIDEVDRGQYDQADFNLDFISGCCLLIKKEVFRQIGLFDQKYFMYLEDVDFSQRALRCGFKLAFVPNAKIWHLNAASSAVGSPLADYFLTRNRLLFGFRYARLRTKIALIRDSFRILTHGSLWQKRGVIDFYFGRLGQGSWK